IILLLYCLCLNSAMPGLNSATPLVRFVFYSGTEMELYIFKLVIQIQGILEAISVVSIILSANLPHPVWTSFDR
ncbi:hypothetical protein L9F63_026528, partial [Diploptera punctata]